MNNNSKEKKSQRDIFIQATQELSCYNPPVTSILIRDMFATITRSMMVLDGLLMRVLLYILITCLGQLGDGKSVAIIRSRIHSEYCQKDYYIPVNILYPVTGKDEDRIRFFLLVSNNTTVNKQCRYVDDNNEIHMSGIEHWRWSDGLIPVVRALHDYFAFICPLFEINPTDIFIPFEELEVKERLGEGQSAVVYHGVYHGQNVALKKMKKIPSEAEYRYLVREFQTQMRFKNQTILEIFGRSEDTSGFPILVMELGGPSLDDLIIEKETKFNFETKKRYLLNVAEALAYLHSYNIVHRDVKLANVLVTNDIAKLADFGFAREIENNKSIEVSFCGSPAIMAPELISSAKCSTKVDVYSFGCVVYETITERRCYSEMEFQGRMDFYNKVLQGLRPLITPGLPVEPVMLMQRCWREDKERPTMKEIVEIIRRWDTSTWDRDVTSK